MIKIVLAMHGSLALYFKEEAERILGNQEDFYAIPLSRQDSPEIMHERLRAVVGQGPSIILVDFPGGTPCNCALGLCRTLDRVLIISGVNFPMILSALTARRFKTYEELAAGIEEEGKKAIRNLTGEMKDDNSHSH